MATGSQVPSVHLHRDRQRLAPRYGLAGRRDGGDPRPSRPRFSGRWSWTKTAKNRVSLILGQRQRVVFRAASGGVAPYTYEIVGCTLPGGLAFGPDGRTLSDPPLETCRGPDCTYRVTDSASDSVSRDFELVVDPLDRGKVAVPHPYRPVRAAGFGRPLGRAAAREPQGRADGRSPCPGHPGQASRVQPPSADGTGKA